jgi:hypothetical protein
MKPLYRQIITVVVLLLVLVGLGVASSNLSSKHQTPTTSATATTKPQTISYQGEDGKNALELLQRNHQVQTQDSSFGTFVTSIDNVAQTENSFWLYYVDGKAGDAAADKTVTQNGQTIEWRYESF